MRPFSRALAAFPLALAIATAGAQSPERHTLTGEHVAVWNLAGRAIVEPTTGREVIVEVTRGGHDGRELTVEASGGRLVVQYPDRNVVYRDGPDWRWETRLHVERDGTFSRDHDDWSSRTVRIRSYGMGLEAHANLRIHVPRGQRLTLHLGVGAIEAMNVEGEIELRTHASSVTASAMKGRVTARTGSGRVTVERSEAEVVASTGSGSVYLDNVRGREVRASTGSGSVNARDITAARFDASTGSGGMRMEGVATDDLRASTGSGSVRIELTKVAREATVRTGSGGVSLTLPEQPNLEVDINTGSGSISTEFPVTMEMVRRRELRGRIGTGADGRVRVTTGSGSVRLLRR